MSVIVPVHNREVLVGPTLDSVWNQTYRPIELVVVDDGSRDGSLREIQRWHNSLPEDPDFDVIMISQPNRGAPTARNVGFAASSGAYIQYLDSDDIISTRKLEQSVNLMTADSDLDMVYSWKGVLKEGRFEMDTAWKARQADLESDPSSTRIALGAVWTPLPLLRRLCVSLAGNWDEELLSLQDWVYFARVAKHVRAAKLIPSVQAYERIHNMPRISKQRSTTSKALMSRVTAFTIVYRLVEEEMHSHRATAMRQLRRKCLSTVSVAALVSDKDLFDELARQASVLIGGSVRGSLELRMLGVLANLPGLVKRVLCVPLRLANQVRIAVIASTKRKRRKV